jgi:hypothetical protein
MAYSIAMGSVFRLPIARVHSLPAKVGKGGTRVEDYYREGYRPLKGCRESPVRFLNGLLTNPGHHPGGRGFSTMSLSAHTNTGRWRAGPVDYKGR